MENELLVGQETFEECHSSASAFAILKDDFLDLGDEPDIKAYLSHHENSINGTTTQQSSTANTVQPSIAVSEKLSTLPMSTKMDDWDQDVLLSNAGLPEMNPLLELGNGVEDDFQKMLNEWENHMDSLQTSDAQPGPPQYILPESSQQQQSPEECSSDDKDDDNLVKGDVEGEGDSQTNPASCSPLIGGAQVSRDMDETDDLEDSRVPSVGGRAFDLTSGSSSCFSDDNSDMGGSPFNVVDVNNSAIIKKELMDEEEDDEEEEEGSLDEEAVSQSTLPSSPPSLETHQSSSQSYSKQRAKVSPASKSPVTSESGVLPKQPVKIEPNSGPSLTGIVICCSPGGHFETYEVLEASDGDQLLDEFEAACQNDLFREFAGGKSSSKSADLKRLQIVDAVQNHFSATFGDNTKKKPRIVPSHRIKDALPREVIEKIKSSSVKSRTIAIIEPVLDGCRTTNETFNQLNSTPFTPPPPPPPATISKPAFQRSHHHSLPMGGSKSAAVPRFQEAASSLNRSKHYRHFGSVGGVVSPPPSVPSPPPPPPIQLDHDYCSSASKIKRIAAASSRPPPPITSAHHATYQPRTTPLVGSRTITYSTSNGRREYTTYPAPSRTGSGSGSIYGKSGQTITMLKKAPVPIVVTSSSGLANASGATVTRPYVRVSTGSRVVTANLLKPTPLSTSAPSVVGLETGSGGSGSNLQAASKAPSSGVVSKLSAGSIKQHQQLTTSSPRGSSNKFPATVVCLQKRRDSDHSGRGGGTKDSGLDSGDTMSDTSEQSTRDAEDIGYSKVPSYLTSVAVKNSDSSSVTPADEIGYDRLPAYIRGVGPKGSGAAGGGGNTRKRVVIVHASETSRSGIRSGGSQRVTTSSAAVGNNTTTSGGGGGGVSAKQVNPQQVADNTSKQVHRGRHCSSSSSEGSTTSVTSEAVAGSAISNQSTTRQTVINHEGAGGGGGDGVSNTSSSEPPRSMSTRSMTTRSSRRTRRSRSSSTSSNCSNTSMSSSTHVAKKRKRTSRGSRSPVPSSRRRLSGSANGSAGNQVGFGSGGGRFTRDRQRREQECRQLDQEGERRNEERRIVYVGKISEGTTRADLRKRFEVFGPILEISVHFRDRGDNYGFITFKYKVDAYEAIEHGNDDPSYPTVDLCFGGRRAFCKEKYSDLDSHMNSSLEPCDFEGGYRLRGGSGDGSTSSSGGRPGVMRSRGGGQGRGSANDFDSLLQQARAGLSSKKQQQQLAT